MSLGVAECARPAHPVFHLKELALARGQPRQLAAARNQLKHHVRRGRAKRVGREVFAAVPFGQAPETYWPDPVLVAACIRPEGIFCHHTALELLGAGHSLWNRCTLFCDESSPAMHLGPQRLQFLSHPAVLRRKRLLRLGVRYTERQGSRLAFTGPERTLVEGFRHPQWVGGLEELVESAAGLGVLNLDLLNRLLRAYDQRRLWAALGWFLERYQERFFVPDHYLAQVERACPPQSRYLVRAERGGQLLPRWNLIVPHRLLSWEGQDVQP